VLVRCEPHPGATSSGLIVLPEGFSEMEQRDVRAGIVVRKGTARELCPARRCNPREPSYLGRLLAGVKVGDRVVFRKFIGEMNDLSAQWGFDADDGDYSILDIEDVLCVVGDSVGVGNLCIRGENYGKKKAR